MANGSKGATVALSCVAALGTVATSVASAIAGSKARKKMDEVGEEFTFKEKLKLTWKYYILPASLCSSTILCIVGSNYMSMRDRLALVSAYNLVKDGYLSYQNKVKEICGEEVHDRIMQELMVEKAQDTHVSASVFGMPCSLEFEGACEEPRLFYDSFSERYFESTISRVLIAEDQLNRNFTLGWTPCVNDLYELLGLEHTAIGEILGWQAEDWDSTFIDFNHRHVVLDDNLDCWIIESSMTPAPFH